MAIGDYYRGAKTWVDSLFGGSRQKSVKAKEFSEKEKFRKEVLKLVGSERESWNYETGQRFLNKNLIERIRAKYEEGTEGSQQLAIAALSEAAMLSTKSKVFQRELQYLLEEEDPDALPYAEMHPNIKAKGLDALTDTRIRAYTSQTPDQYVPVQFLSEDSDEIKEQLDCLCKYKEGKLYVSRILMAFLSQTSDKFKRAYNSALFDFVSEKTDADTRKAQNVVQAIQTMDPETIISEAYSGKHPFIVVCRDPDIYLND